MNQASRQPAARSVLQESRDVKDGLLAPSQPSNRNAVHQGRKERAESMHKVHPRPTTGAFRGPASRLHLVIPLHGLGVRRRRRPRRALAAVVPLLARAPAHTTIRGPALDLAVRAAAVRRARRHGRRRLGGQLRATGRGPLQRSPLRALGLRRGLLARLLRLGRRGGHGVVRDVVVGDAAGLGVVEALVGPRAGVARRALVVVVVRVPRDHVPRVDQPGDEAEAAEADVEEGVERADAPLDPDWGGVSAGLRGWEGQSGEGSVERVVVGGQAHRRWEGR